MQSEFIMSSVLISASVYISLHFGRYLAFNSTMGKGQTTNPGTTWPTLHDESVGSLTSPADHNSEDAGDGAYGLSSLSEKTISNHLQISLQRQHIFLSYFKTLSVGLVWGEFDSGSSGPSSSPGRRHCAVFLSKTLHSHSTSLHPGV